MSEDSPEVEYSADALVQGTLTEAMLHRPKVWTRTGSFNEIIAFLYGRFIRIPNGLEAEKEECRQWFAFWQWLEDKWGLDLHVAQERILEQSGSDEKAIAELLRLWAEFKAENDNGGTAGVAAT